MKTLFEDANTQLVVITTDSPAKNRRIAGGMGLSMPILSDPKGEVLKALGMWDPRWDIAAYGYYLLDGGLGVISRQRGYWGVDRDSVMELLQELPAAARGS